MGQWEFFFIRIIGDSTDSRPKKDENLAIRQFKPRIHTEMFQDFRTDQRLTHVSGCYLVYQWCKEFMKAWPRFKAANRTTGKLERLTPSLRFCYFFDRGDTDISFELPSWTRNRLSSAHLCYPSLWTCLWPPSWTNGEVFSGSARDRTHLGTFSGLGFRSFRLSVRGISSKSTFDHDRGW